MENFSLFWKLICEKLAKRPKFVCNYFKILQNFDIYIQLLLFDS